MTSVSFTRMRLFTGMIACASLLGGAALAQEGTEAQRAACTPDAFRLCGQFIPDASRIESCLRAAGPKLSPACYVVFNPPVEKKPAPLRTAHRQAPETVGQAPQRAPADAEAMWADE